MNVGVAACDDSEPDVSGSASRHEPGGAPSRIGTHLHQTRDDVGVVADMMPDSDLVEELPDGLIEQVNVVGDGVRSGVAGGNQVALMSKRTTSSPEVNRGVYNGSCEEGIHLYSSPAR